MVGEIVYTNERFFDPEGKEYDFQTAIINKLGPDDYGNWMDIEPQTGMILKGKNNPDFKKIVKEQKSFGKEIIKSKDDGRYYVVESRK